MFLLCALGQQICKVMCRFLSPYPWDAFVKGQQGTAPPAQYAVPPPSAEGAPERGEAALAAQGGVPGIQIVQDRTVRPAIARALVQQVRERALHGLKRFDTRFKLP